MPNNPYNPTGAAIITGGAGLLGQGINAFSQGAMNRKTRKWNEKMYGIQRQNALEDWALQNEYNHPSSQMARLREAGLNPNLVYGNGATTEAGAVRSTDSGNWNPRAPQLDLSSVAGSSLGAYYDTQVKQAQVDNLRVQNTVGLQEALLKAAQTWSTLSQAEKTGVETKRARFDLSQAERLKDIVFDAQVHNVDKIRAEASMAMTEADFKAIKERSSLEVMAEQVLRSRAERAKNADERREIEERIKNLGKDQQLKDLDIQLKKLGLQPGDAMYMRILGRWLSGIGFKLPK